MTTSVSTPATKTAPASPAAAAPSNSSPGNATGWAKGALRRLAQSQQEPTPENYARAYAAESGVQIAAPRPLSPEADPAPADGGAWVLVVERLVRHLDRPGQQWTPARRKDSLQRVLASSRSDAGRLLQRLQGLTTAWENDQPAAAMDLGLTADAAPATELADASAAVLPVRDQPAAPSVKAEPGIWPEAAQALHLTVQAGLPATDPRALALAAELADALAAVASAMADENAVKSSVESADVDGQFLASSLAELQRLCLRAQSLFAHRQHLVDELSALCRELAAGLTDLVEDDTWAHGQCASLQARLNPAAETAPGPSGSPVPVPSVRNVRAATELLAETRSRQQQVRLERQAAQTTLKTLIQRMIGQASELGDQAGRYQQSLGQHAQAIAGADSLEGLAGVVQAMLDDNQAVQRAFGATRERLHEDQTQAQSLQARVRELENQLRRLSDEAATDALTQVANRRGLGQAFAALITGGSSTGGPASTALAVGLLDIDNFKKLNDTLGHAAGDQALKALAAAVRERLRPIDHIARFGGEEFVVLMPETPLAEAQQALTRLQRGLSAGLFMHEGKDVLVTFSAGVTTWRSGETLEAALERADQALYEAKRTGKNRTCVA